MCEFKKNEVCTIFFRGVTTHQSYLYIFVHLPPTLALSDVHKKVANRIRSIVYVYVCVCVCVCVCWRTEYENIHI